MGPITKITFALEPPFTAISSHEIDRAFGLEPGSRQKVTGQLVVEDGGDDPPVPRIFGVLDTLWSPITLAGAVNFLLSHPKAREVYLLTPMPVSASRGAVVSGGQ